MGAFSLIVVINLLNRIAMKEPEIEIKPEHMNYARKLKKVAIGISGFCLSLTGYAVYSTLQEHQEIRMRMLSSRKKGSEFILNTFYSASRSLSGIDYKALDDAVINSLEKDK